ncbi:MAG: hypothetical protein ACO1OB_32525 [Archangium sp.]
MAPLPDAKHLLELLQRAADELKASQAESAELAQKLKSVEADRDRLKGQLEDIGTTTIPPGRELIPLQTVPMAKTTLQLSREEKTSVSGGDELLAVRVQTLENELAELSNEKKALRERVRELEDAQEVTRHPNGELEHELSNTRQQLIVEQARGADLLTRVNAWEARSKELEAELAATRAAADEELAQIDTLAGQVSQFEAELTSERAKTQALEEQLRTLEQGTTDEAKKLFDATSRIAQLEVELGGLKARRDELNIEIGKVENERNASRAKAAELETAAEKIREQLTAEHAAAMSAQHTRYTELEVITAREKDKHSITAQKLLEARGRQRELEEGLHKSMTQVEELQRSIQSQAESHVRDNAELRGQVEQLTAQLENATNEWRHADKQYSQLHSEMMVLLDQRDEARRELETIKTRFGIR